MARVSVEKQALTDLRFTILGSHLDPIHQATPQEINSAFGLYMAIRAWDYCSDRGILDMHRRDLEAIRPGLADAMIDAELAEVVKNTSGKRVRLKGGFGRLDWSERARRNGALGAEHGKKGAEFGKLGGRPSSINTPHAGVSKTPLRGDTKTPPLTLTQALALSRSVVPPKTEIDPTSVTAPKTRGDQVRGDLEPGAPERRKAALRDWMDLFGLFWPHYPRKVAKQAALKAWRSIAPADPDDVEPKARGVGAVLGERKRRDWAGRDQDKIPHASTFLRAEEFPLLPDGGESHARA